MKLFIKSSYTIALVFSLLISGCGNNEEKKNIAIREQNVLRREQELKLLDQQLKLKEQELAGREQRLDSADSVLRDSVGVYDAKIIGDWTISMQCTETNCTGYAVGDVKTEQWNISYDNNKVLVRAYVNKTVVRTYSGLFINNMVKLTANLSDAQTRIDVILRPELTNEKLMSGRRVINHEGECRTVFDIRAEKL